MAPPGYCVTCVYRQDKKCFFEAPAFNTNKFTEGGILLGEYPAILDIETQWCGHWADQWPEGEQQ